MAFSSWIWNQGCSSGRQHSVSYKKPTLITFWSKVRQKVDHYRTDEVIGPTWNFEPKKISIKDDLHLSQSEDFNEARFREIKESDFDWLKHLWTRCVGWKVWAQLAKLATAFVFVSSRIIGFIVEKYNRRWGLGSNGT
jgi:hypothetical protein